MTDSVYRLAAEAIARRGPVLEVPQVIKGSRAAYEKTPGRKASHKRWVESGAGKKSAVKRKKAYCEAHPEKIREKEKRSYEKHKAEIAFKRKVARAADPEAARAKKKACPSSSPEYKRAYNKAYKARKRLETQALKGAA